MAFGFASRSRMRKSLANVLRMFFGKPLTPGFMTRAESLPQPHRIPLPFRIQRVSRLGIQKLFVLFSLLFSLPAFSGQLDLAVVQFPEAKTVAQLEEALVGVRLAALTNSNRTMTKTSCLKDGYVLFFQTLPAASRFQTITRLSNNRADVEGSLGNGRIAVSIALSEGVAAGLRHFSRRVFQGASKLKAGQPYVVGLRQISEKTSQITRGDVHSKETLYCTAIIAQLTE